MEGSVFSVFGDWEIWKWEKKRKRKRGPGHFLHPVQYELHVSASEWNRINSARFPSAAKLQKRVEHTHTHKQARETSVTRDCHLFLNFDFYSKTALCIIWQCNFRGFIHFDTGYCWKIPWKRATGRTGCERSDTHLLFLSMHWKKKKNIQAARQLTLTHLF